jgi:hypothetical protein
LRHLEIQDSCQQAPAPGADCKINQIADYGRDQPAVIEVAQVGQYQFVFVIDQEGDNAESQSDAQDKPERFLPLFAGGGGGRL